MQRKMHQSDHAAGLFRPVLEELMLQIEIVDARFGPRPAAFSHGLDAGGSWSLAMRSLVSCLRRGKSRCSKNGLRLRKLFKRVKWLKMDATGGSG